MSCLLGLNTWFVLIFVARYLQNLPLGGPSLDYEVQERQQEPLWSRRTF